MIKYLKDKKKAIVNGIIKFTLIGIITLIIELFYFGFNNVNISSPISYGGDSITGIQSVNNLLNGSNYNLGWIYNENTEQYTQTIGQMETAFKLLCSIFTDDPIAVFNLFVIIVPWLNVIVCYYVFEYMKIRGWIAYLSALAFGFCPYVQYRIVGHMSLATIECIPILFLLCFWCIEEESFNAINKQWYKNKRNWIGLVFAWMIADNGMVYYPVFSCFILLVLTMCLFFSENRKRSLASVVCIVEIAIFEAINFIPVVVGIISGSGNNTALAISRTASHAEVYGLRISSLLLSPNGYGISDIKESLSSYTAINNENKAAYIGIIGIIGLAILVISLLSEKKLIDGKSEKEKLFCNRISFIAKANACVMLLAAIGSISYIVAMVVSHIRCYNRISPFIVFMCVMSVAFMLEILLVKYKEKSLIFRSIFTVVITLIFGYSIIEQQGCYKYIDADRISSLAEAYQSDKMFFKELEDRAGEGALVFQLPYMRSFENGPIKNISDYDHMRCVLNTDTIKWSYGAVNGSRNDKFYRSLSCQEPHLIVSKLYEYGFSGIYLNLNGYSAEEGAYLRDSFVEFSGCTDIVTSNDNKCVYIHFDDVDVEYSTVAIEGVDYYLDDGFSTMESNEQRSWIWCEQTAEMKLSSNSDKKYIISFCPSTKVLDEYNLYVEFNGDEYVYPISSQQERVNIEIDVPVGETIIKFSSDCPQVDAPNDPRTMYFRMFDLEIQCFNTKAQTEMNDELLDKVA